MAADPIIIPCEACGNRGMVNGARCETCNGQGHVRAGRTPDVPESGEVPAVQLDRLKLADLKVIAEQAGLDTSGTRADLIERIQAAPASTETPEPEATDTPEEPAAA